MVFFNLEITEFLVGKFNFLFLRFFINVLLIRFCFFWFVNLFFRCNNFIFFVFDRGNILKNIEKECNVKIMIRGKGFVKEGKVGRKDG